MGLDSQQIEILGRSALTAALVADGIEVAHPERDAGIDLLAFTVDPWAVVPIQMKAATTERFSLDRKYERIPGLVMVYVWHARSAGEAVFYAMSWEQAKAIADELGWTDTATWRGRGTYTNNQPGERVKAAIAPHRMEQGKWAALIGTQRPRMRLVFSRPSGPGERRAPEVIEGDTATELLDRWNAGPWWADYSPTEFRERIVDLLGADVDPEQADEEILPALVEADPNITLEVVE